MIINVKINNCFVFSNEVELSLKADMRNKKFASNVYTENYFNILKTVGIYGQNNVGKTCLLRCINEIRNVLLNKSVGIMSNIFTDSSICDLGITFLEGGRKFTYDFKYDASVNEYIYEKFVEIFKDQYNNEKEVIKILKDTENEEYICEDELLKNMIHVTSKNNILIYTLETEKFNVLKEVKGILVGFASKIDFVNMNNIPMNKTIELLKSDNRSKEKIVNFIKNADIYMDDFLYAKNEQIQIEVNSEDKIEPEINEEILKAKERIIEHVKLVSVYKGVAVPSLIFDSTGTKKIAALASYIIDALEQGRILLVDEIDSSIHFKLARAVIAMFNNELNTKAQLIFNAHDLNLMDCKKLFRKEQIWFIDKDDDNVYVYSLASFTSEKDGIRGDTSDIGEKYRKGMLGALPEPDLLESLLEVTNGRK